ncbi:CHAT domain-containing protein [Winogradskyella sp.]|uniref:CHAT domain-containing protein n=1 Tax=Winogradskyella sp. TaxID=1883156 RepID=UPI0035179903
MKVGSIIVIFYCFGIIITVACSSQKPDLSSNSWKRHFNYAKNQLESNNAKDALSHLEKSYTILKKSNKSANKNLGEVAELLATAYVENKKRKKAINCYSTALEYYEISNKIGDPRYSRLLYLHGLNYRYIGDYEKAIETYKRRLKVIESTDGKETDDYATTLNAISIAYRRFGKYSEAVVYNKQSINIVKSIYGENSTEHLKKLNSLSKIYWSLGKYNEGFAMQEDLLSRYPKQVRDTSYNYASAIFTMSLLYNGTNQYQNEIRLLNEFKQIMDRTPKYRNNKIHADNNLAVAYDNIGDYQKAISIIKNVIKNTTNYDTNYPKRLQNLAYYQARLGNYAKALKTYDKAIEACKTIYGFDHSNYAQLIDAKGQMHLKKGELIKAEQHFKEAMSVLDSNKDIKNTHSEYGFYLNNYARSLLAQGRYDEAIITLKKGIKLSEEDSIPDPVRYYRKQQDLAEAYMKTKKYDEALSILKKYEVDVALRLGENHQDYGTYLKNLGKAYLLNSNHEEAYRYFNASNAISISQIDKVFKFRTEKENKEFMEMLRPEFDELQALAIDNEKLSSQLININLNNQLLLKNLLLSQSKQIIEKLLYNTDSITANKVFEYRQLKSKVSELVSSSISQKIENLDSLYDILNSKEAELTKLYAEKYDTETNLKRDWVLSKKELKNNELAIEFSNFRYAKGDTLNDSHYVAYLYKKDLEHPKMVSLFNERDLLKLIKDKSPSELYKTRGSKAKSISNFESIYHLIWKPLETELDNVNTIYFSPSGILNQIPFGALAADGDKRLIDKYRLIRLSTTGKLQERSKQIIPNDILIYGGIEYDYTTNGKMLDSTLLNIKELESFKSSKTSNTKGDFWDYLPGTLNEVESLKANFDNYEISYQIFSGKEASEEAFKNLDGNSPKIIHIATHGFFYENYKHNNTDYVELGKLSPYTYSEDPLLRSGLILAGGNYAWKNGTNPYEQEDGILTSLEISNLNLSNTDLVVLSACETGLGDIEGSEGVYGLQRAFKMAGVDLILMSLWEVPDKETSEFMQTFYDKWLGGLNVRSAFNQTQRTMSKKYNKNPEKWAAFVLFE